MHLLVLSEVTGGAKALLPSLEFLDHTTATARLTPESLQTVTEADLLVVDATDDLGAASQVCRMAATRETHRPILVVITEGSLAALKSNWGFEDWILPRAGPAEVETRLRLLTERAGGPPGSRGVTIGELAIDEDTYIIRLRGRPLDLTFREFELLSFLANNPNRVFTRSQLLSEVWGYDYFGGTRTVDVHIRRLRAKLGPEHEHFLATVRGVGYKLDPEGPGRWAEPSEPAPGWTTEA